MVIKSGEIMRKLICLIKNIIYSILIILLSIDLINENPLPFFIFGLWLLLIAYSLYKGNILMYRILIPYFNNRKNQSNQVRISEFRVTVIASIILFILGFYEFLTS